MLNIKELISAISSDKRVVLLGYYGSYADNTYSDLSDIDFFVVLKNFEKLLIDGIHYQDKDLNEIDFLLFSYFLVEFVYF